MIANAQSLQDLVDNFSLGNQNSTQLINDAVMPALSVVRQQFRLERDGKYYGKNNRSFYGESFSLGVKITGGELLQKQVLCPWSYDDDYQQLYQTGKYKPVLSRSFQRELCDSTYKIVDLELGTEYIKPISGDSLVFLHADAHNDFGLIIDEFSGEKSGYMIWVYSSWQNDSAMQFSLKQSHMKIVTNKDSIISVKPKDQENAIGGLYVVPVVERVGLIRVKLVGVCAKTDKKEWLLCLLTKDENQKSKNGKKSSAKSKKDAKNSDPTPIK